MNKRGAVHRQSARCPTPTSPRIFELFSRVDWFRHVAGKEDVVYPVKLNQIQRKVLRLLRIPRKVYELNRSR